MLFHFDRQHKVDLSFESPHKSPNVTTDSIWKAAKPYFPVMQLFYAVQAVSNIYF